RPHRGGARAPRADPRRAGDEPAHVEPRRDPGERRAAPRARGGADRPRGGRARGGRHRRGADGRAGGDRGALRGAPPAGLARPAERSEAKRPKDDAPWEVRLEPTTDVLRELGARRQNGGILVGFAADEGEQGLVRAREKRNRKGADLIVYNDVGRTDIGFDAVE